MDGGERPIADVMPAHCWSSGFVIVRLTGKTACEMLLSSLVGPTLALQIDQALFQRSVQAASAGLPVEQGKILRKQVPWKTTDELPRHQQVVRQAANKYRILQ